MSQDLRLFVNKEQTILDRIFQGRKVYAAAPEDKAQSKHACRNGYQANSQEYDKEERKRHLSHGAGLTAIKPLTESLMQKQIGSPPA
ncbi:hypothetical protein [Shewanella loihica]|uniref:hypothetical protein n=1 Tax=Shewanella loihica TaxID=359303 RepID=UPI00031811BF|nr:hypothetical protein [Shewanella loihica]